MVLIALAEMVKSSHYESTKKEGWRVYFKVKEEFGLIDGSSIQTHQKKRRWIRIKYGILFVVTLLALIVLGHLRQ